MKEKDLFRAIGDISDDLIAEAEGAAKRVRRVRVRKIFALAAALVMLLNVTAWAAKIVLSGRSSDSRNIPDYYSIPSAEQLMADVGIAPAIPERFESGFEFVSGNIVKNEDYGADGSVFEEYKSLNCRYEKDGDDFSLYVDAAMAGNQMDDCETAGVYKGSEIKYISYVNKCVPGDYKLTQKDKEDEKSGKYVFSYGSIEVEIHNVQILGWEYKGLNYGICAIDSSLSKDGLVSMAKEMIDWQDGGAR